MTMQLEIDPVVDPNDNGQEFTHIIDRGDDLRPARIIVLEAMLAQTPITALCGYTWVPSKNPEELPLCPKCFEIFDFAKDFRGVA
jgi:hypothetical protein